MPKTVWVVYVSDKYCVDFGAYSYVEKVFSTEELAEHFYVNYTNEYMRAHVPEEFDLCGS